MDLCFIAHDFYSYEACRTEIFPFTALRVHWEMEETPLSRIEVILYFC